MDRSSANFGRNADDPILSLILLPSVYMRIWAPCLTILSCTSMAVCASSYMQISGPFLHGGQRDEPLCSRSPIFRLYLVSCLYYSSVAQLMRAANDCLQRLAYGGQKGNGSPIIRNGEVRIFLWLLEYHGYRLLEGFGVIPVERQALNSRSRCGSSTGSPSRSALL